MNTLGKTLVAVVFSIVVILVLVFSRDFGAPAGRRGEGFDTPRESVEEGMGASYNVDTEIGKIDFEDGMIYLCKTKDQKISVSYLFKNRQQDKYYFESYYIIENLTETQWYDSKNKVKTNFLVTTADDEIKNCDNKPVECEEYTVKINDDTVRLKLYYNRVD